MSDLSAFEYDGELVVDSRLIAQELNIEHDSFMSTIQTYQTLTEQEFGIFRFQIGKTKGRGRPERYVYLSEDQATFLMTLSRNTPEVVQCKLKLVKAFSKAKKDRKRQEDVKSQRSVPYWYQRMRLALSDINKPLPDGHFCIYLRMMDFFSQVEIRLNYLVPDISPTTAKRLIPDISIGRKFNEFLRSEDEIETEARKKFLGSTAPVDFRESGNDANEIQMYNHVYPESSHGKNNIQEARAYPIKYSSIFDYFLQEWWIPDRCLAYLKERDPEGVEYIKESIRLMPSEQLNILQTTLLGKFIRGLLPPAKN